MKELLIRMLEAVVRGLRSRTNTSADAAAGAEEASPVLVPVEGARVIAAPERHHTRTQMGHTIEQCVAAGHAAVNHFSPVLEDYGDLDSTAGVIIRVVDFSGSTIGTIGNALAPALEASRRELLERGLDGYLWDLGFNRRVFALDDANPLRSLRTARVIRPSDFTRGGFVESGTNLSMGLTVAIAIGIAHRESGHEGKITTMGWTDGWDISGSADRRRCREALELARRRGVKVEVHGFCPKHHWSDYQAWKSDVGLLDEEDCLQVLDPHAAVEDVVERSVTGIGESMTHTVMRIVRPRDSDSDTPAALA